ncbi:plant intracellular Ras-group-related LRR protein 5-like [Anneissia japonica]|uniref:plant intracellular Ras-group-related LRR protein 5-like n=1 Tax=Anneissia japonica TaxID=1529436 RepID=UPI0014259D24|nr:plant intracellular Ras-group-related LRR protein 5-like [Anneissia japonica]
MLEFLKDTWQHLQDVIFVSGNAASVSIIIFVITMLVITIGCVVTGLISGKDPPPKKRKKYISRGTSSVVSCHATRHLTGRNKKKHFLRSNSSSNNVVVTTHELPPRLTNTACVSCGIVAAKRSCQYDLCATCCRKNQKSICNAHGTGLVAVQNLVECACCEKPIELDLSYLELKQCPNRIGYVGTQLATLNLSNNRLVLLPLEIGCLRGLKELFLQYNCLQSLPETIGYLTNLHELDCKNNQLHKLPSNLGNLSNLTVLNVINNQLKALPVSIGKLGKLEELYAHSNKLKGLPEEICNLLNLTALYVGENQLKNLPARIGQLYCLKELDLSSCSLSSLPDSISRCTSLIRVWLSNNRLRVLPDQIGRLHSLKELHVRNNQIEYFPASLATLQLYTFSANNNPLLSEVDRKSWCHYNKSPSTSMPSLFEICARKIISANVRRKEGELPKEIEKILSAVRFCSSCEGPFVYHFKSEVCFNNVGIFHRVPLYQQICSPNQPSRCPPLELS